MLKIYCWTYTSYLIRPVSYYNKYYYTIKNYKLGSIGIFHILILEKYQQQLGVRESKFDQAYPEDTFLDKLLKEIYCEQLNRHLGQFVKKAIVPDFIEVSQYWKDG